MKINSVLHGLLLLLGISLLFACKTESSTETESDAGSETEKISEEPATPRDILYVIHDVKDYTSWKKGFDDHASVRVENGVHTIGVAKNLNNPNKIHLSFFIDDLTKAQEFAGSDDLKSKMEELGVTGPPEMHYLKVLNLVTEPTDISDRVMVSHEVKDYEVWKKAYDENKPNRDKHGLSERALLHSVDNANDVFMVFAYTDRSKVEEMLNSEDLKSVMEKAGVIGELDVQFINWEELNVK